MTGMRFGFERFSDSAFSWDTIYQGGRWLWTGKDSAIGVGFVADTHIRGLC
jgi:hypothetical protein